MDSTQRPAPLGQFVLALCSALDSETSDSHEGRAAARRIASALERPADAAPEHDPSTLAACRYLDRALDLARHGPAPVQDLAETLSALAPLLAWKHRAGSEAVGAAFHHGHANTWMVGPDGMERREDVVVGATLMQPGVTYPHHDHPPEELYVVMSEGDWFNEKAGWYTPGVGGIVYHEPGIVHAMRAGDAPLLAVWCLWTG